MSVMLTCFCVTLCVVYEYKVACKGVRVHGGWFGGLSWLGPKDVVHLCVERELALSVFCLGWGIQKLGPYAWILSLFLLLHFVLSSTRQLGFLAKAMNIPFWDSYSPSGIR